MAMTLDELQKLFAAEGISVFVAPDRSALLGSFRGINGAYQVVFLLEVEGTFVQFRTLNWLRCPAEHPSLPAVLKVVGEENYTRRLVKIGWDPEDGELTAYADVWVEDGALSPQQFSRMMHVYLPVMDMAYGRISATIETGRDPGEVRPEDLGRGAPEGSLPGKIREVLDQLRRKQDEEPVPVGGTDDDMI